MGYFGKGLFEFLKGLADNNTREWFTENKERYERDVKDPFLDFIADAGPGLRSISPNLVADPRPAGGSMFRIYRDVRFSKDKSPYKTHAGAHFQLSGKGVHGPGYYLHLEPAQCFVAGGMWMPEPDALRAIRERIAERPDEWQRVRRSLDHPEDALKRPPRGFDPDHPMIEDIKRKSFTASTRLSQKQVLAPDLMTTFLSGCREIAPLMRFLANAVDVPWS
ncbi:MAG: DUF2461 domain-containing protein [Actinobacteria bacterium]|nr:DUF2461 domain-containing protein [Actinomycetota bacterium]